MSIVVVELIEGRKIALRSSDIASLEEERDNCTRIYHVNGIVSFLVNEPFSDVSRKWNKAESKSLAE